MSRISKKASRGKSTPKTNRRRRKTIDRKTVVVVVLISLAFLLALARTVTINGGVNIRI